MRAPARGGLWATAGAFVAHVGWPGGTAYLTFPNLLSDTYLQAFLVLTLPVMGLVYALLGGLKLPLAERLGLDEGRVAIGGQTSVGYLEQDVQSLNSDAGFLDEAMTAFASSSSAPS